MAAQKDLIHETSISTGTGNFTTTLVNGKVQFGDSTNGFGTGSTTNVFDYYIMNRDAAEWERGTGHCSALGTLVRDSVAASSNANALVSFSAGTKDVTNDVPASQQARIKVTTNGDSNYTILSTDRIVATSAALTAARTWTLPAANSLPPGTPVQVIDALGGVSATNPLSVVRAGSDTINGGSGNVTLNRAYGWTTLETDGTSKWTIVGVSRAKKITVYTSGSGTHTPDALCTEMRVRMVGPGGGGEGSGSASIGVGSNGANTTFGALTATGGAGGNGSNGGTGGGASGGNVCNITGGSGSGSELTSGQFSGGNGGCSAFGGGGGGGTVGGAGLAGATSTGGGGGGASNNNGAGARAGAGGGAGGYVEHLYNSPTAQSYAVGVIGAGGTAGTSGFAGGNGGTSQIIVEEDFR